MSDGESMMDWTPAARVRLERVPPFLRSMVRKRAEALACERGDSQVTGEHLTELAANRPGGAAPDPAKSEPGARTGGASQLVWTAAARERLEELPPFFRAEISRVAEETARAGGHLEVNLALLDALESDEEFRRRLTWLPESEDALEAALEDRAEMVRPFVRPAMEESAEQIARAEGRDRVVLRDVERAFATEGAGVEWSLEALARVRKAPEFVRGGIKKAAEAAARREGLKRIEPDDLTRFRNRAMMRAVKRMRGFGYRELTFDAFETARERVPRLRDNPQAEKRFAAIRSHVEGKGGLGVIDADLLARMKRFLRDGKKE